MSQPIIEVNGISKRYNLGSIGATRIRDDLERAWLRFRGLAEPVNRSDFWALRDVSFQVQPGEVVGIIGRNGAGKSTLLKVLSRITAPTSGEIVLRGRVASLLEVGTGFHPDLTGRENVFLNGAILGMTKAEIRAKFDEIVAFAEVDTFINTPVKRYSSGMYVRLAFAVAAHLEPEILVIDEVLAVGDAAFQQKCIGKMKQVSGQGRTVLFVSHNINAISALCSVGVVLKRGELVYAGDLRTSLTHYGAASEVSSSVDFTASHPGAVLKEMRILQHGQDTNGLLEAGRPVTFEFELDAVQKLRLPKLSVAFTNTRGERVCAVGSWLGPRDLPPMQGLNKISINFEFPPIVPGRFALDIGLYDAPTGLHEEHYSAAAVEVAETNYLNMVDPTIAEIGVLFVRSSFTVTS